MFFKDLCFEVMNFIYHNIATNVGLAIIIYVLFARLIFIPFSLKRGYNKARATHNKRKLNELRSEFLALPEEDRANEEIKQVYKEREKALKKKKNSFVVGIIVFIARLTIIIMTTSVITNFDKLIHPAPEAYRFLGFELNTVPGWSLGLIFPIATTLVLVIPSFISTIKNIKNKKANDALKTKEELEEEARVLKEMGIKENKVPWGLLLQVFIAGLTFWLFVDRTLMITLFWGSYYMVGILEGKVIDFVFSKISKQLFERKRKKSATQVGGDQKCAFALWTRQVFGNLRQQSKDCSSGCE